MLLGNGLAQTQMTSRTTVSMCLLIPVFTSTRGLGWPVLLSQYQTNSIKDMGVLLWPVLISFNRRKPSILWTQMYF